MKKNSKKKDTNTSKKSNSSQTQLFALKYTIGNLQEGQIGEKVLDIKYPDFDLIAFDDFQTDILPCSEPVRATYYVRKDLLEPIGYL